MCCTLCRFDQQSPLVGMSGEPRRPCPFGKHRLQEQDDMMKRMAAARFGPSLLSSLLSAVEVRLRF